LAQAKILKNHMKKTTLLLIAFLPLLAVTAQKKNKTMEKI